MNPNSPPRPADGLPSTHEGRAEDDDATRIVPASPDGDQTQIFPATQLLRPHGDTEPLTPMSPPRQTPAAAPALFDAPPTLTAHDRAAARQHTLPPQTEVPGAHAPTSAEVPVQQVGRYLIRDRLGRGGMATVYRAHDPQIGRDVAIKFLHASLSEDDECRTRFLRESRAAGGLSHPNIVVVHDVGEIKGRPYMAMELVDGEPLSAVLDRTRQLPVREVVLFGLQLARALEYAHARGIVHRDIKPGNVMVLSDGQTIKVTDFGIAHMDDGGEQRTQVGAVLGTPQYMSPEQTRGERLDGRSDLFSAGIVLYQMLAGERPFRGDSLVAVATRIASEEPPPLAGKRPDVPPALRRIVERCLAKAPAQRWQSGRELADALSKVLASIDEAARERARDQRRIVPLRVKWALLMGGIVAVVMGLTTAVIAQRQQAALMTQVSGWGGSLARFIAAQNAASVLGEEWEAVDVQLQEVMKTRDFERISVIGLDGIVRASSEAALVGQPYVAPGGAAGGAGGPVSRYTSQGDTVLGFEAPVLFQGKPIGRVALGIAEAPLTQVARLSAMLMAVLAAVTVLAVALAMYIVGNRFAKPIRLATDAMDEVAKGRFDHRIGEQRNDEFGQLFDAFDAMAASLQQQRDGSPAGPATTPSGATLPPGAPTLTAVQAPERAEEATLPGSSAPPTQPTVAAPTTLAPGATLMARAEPSPSLPAARALRADPGTEPAQDSFPTLPTREV